jgi:hypothetical protein
VCACAVPLRPQAEVKPPAGSGSVLKPPVRRRAPPPPDADADVPPQ